MEIQNVSTGSSLQATQEQAAVQAQDMTLDRSREQGDAVTQMLEGGEAVTDPNVGNQVDLLA